MKRIFGIALFAVALSGFAGGSAAKAAPFDFCSDEIRFGMPQVLGPARLAAVCHAGYAAAVDQDYLVPRWVAYVLTAEHAVGCTARTDDFHPEESLRGRVADPRDYSRSGYDRGHQAPAEDFAWNPQEMHDSFSMANMAPQVPDLNREEWEHLEESVRAWALERGELQIYVGPVIGQNPARIGNDGVAVPVGFWKVIVDPGAGEALAFMMPQRGIPKGDLRPWLVSIAEIERVAGVTLPVPQNIDPNMTTSLWKTNIAGWRKLKKATCG